MRIIGKDTIVIFEGSKFSFFYIDGKLALVAESIADSASISDSEVIESVRKAALKTDFNSNYDAPEMAEGTITYTFKKK